MVQSYQRVQNIGLRCREIHKLLRFGSKTPRNSNDITLKIKRRHETAQKSLRFGYRTPKIPEEEMQETVQKLLEFGYKTPKIPMRLMKTQRRD